MKMRVVIHHFDQNAHAMIRFGRGIEIIGIYDEREKYWGIDPGEYLGIRKTGIRISNKFEPLLDLNPDMVVTTGEGLYFTKEKNVKEWFSHVREALSRGIPVYSMSKIYYGKKTLSLKELAKKHKTNFIEASDPDYFDKIRNYAILASEERIKRPVLVFAGTSMNSGKITAMLTIRDELEKRGIRVGTVGTEPCSKFLGCNEQVVPEVIPTMRGAQAIAGTIKKVEVEENPDVILIGSQTGLRTSALDVKESRAGAVVAWQILMGAQPDWIILCSKWSMLDEIGPCLNLIKYGIERPVIGIAINGFGSMNPRETVEKAEDMYNILAFDVVSTPRKTREMVDRIENLVREKEKGRRGSLELA